MEGRDDGFGGPFHELDELRNAWIPGIGELLDVRARNEGSALAAQDHRVDVRVFAGLVDCFDQARSHGIGERVDGWVHHGQDENASVTLLAQRAGIGGRITHRNMGFKVVGASRCKRAFAWT
ncbi:hypothetical protein D3C71_1845890 [compost metagenome]